MKKIVSVICFAIVSFLLFPTPVSADEVKENLSLEIKGVPEGTEVEWSSSDPTVAVVDDGVVKAVGNGTVVITAKEKWECPLCK